MIRRRKPEMKFFILFFILMLCGCSQKNDAVKAAVKDGCSIDRIHVGEWNTWIELDCTAVPHEEQLRKINQ